MHSSRPFPATTSSTSVMCICSTRIMRIFRFSSPFTVASPQNRHLRQEYLAVLETNHHTPYFLNLHHRDVAHTMILGRTGAGKSFLLNFLITNLQKYDPWTFIFDLGGSFESLTQLFGGSYVKIGFNSADFKINPFSLPPTKENLDFLALFVKVLMQGSSPSTWNPARNAISTTRLRICIRSTHSFARLEFWQIRWDIGLPTGSRSGPRRPIRFPLRQLRRHDFVFPFPVFRLPEDESISRTSGTAALSTSCIAQTPSLATGRSAPSSRRFSLMRHGCF